MVHIPPTAAVPQFAFTPRTVVDATVPPGTAATAGVDDPAVRRFSLAGKSAIITGGSGGLGFSAACALAEHGVRDIHIFDLAQATGPQSTTTSATTTLTTRFSGMRATLHAVDVTSTSDVASAVAATGPVDLLLTFAGVVGVAPAASTSTAEWERILSVNATGTFTVAREVARVNIAAQRPASMVLVASISGHAVNFPQPQIAYNVSKAAVLHMARCLAAEWARHGIRVNTISPGYMDTVLNEGDGLEVHRRVWCERTPLGRMGTREELNGAVILLCSEAGSFITGTDIRVDGGILAM